MAVSQATDPAITVLSDLSEFFALCHISIQGISDGQPCTDAVLCPNPAVRVSVLFCGSVCCLCTVSLFMSLIPGL